MGLLNVPQSQWEIAQQFFSQHAGAKKLKKNDTQGFSFIKANGQLYAMANGLYIGEGGFSKVKMVENNHGKNFVVKIEGKGFDKRAVNEVLVLKKLGKHIGVMERDLGEEKEFWKSTKGKSL
ncbi:MAG TPA: hypothetical protein PLD88_15210, partial [Candidatus Berkiella sp.]|nr:hypothetical protein [Candidatus Berkiella sp.]